MQMTFKLKWTQRTKQPCGCCTKHEELEKDYTNFLEAMTAYDKLEAPKRIEIIETPEQRDFNQAIQILENLGVLVEHNVSMEDYKLNAVLVLSSDKFIAYSNFKNKIVKT